MFRTQSILIFFCGFISLTGLFAQENQSWADEHLDFRGYVKYLNTTKFEDLKLTLNDNLIHNRLQLKAYISNHVTFDIEVRNRVFWGNSLALIPYYADFINASEDRINLGGYLVEEPGFLVHSLIDRLYVDFHTDQWQITLGRQRINWGKNLVWNTNDLFNAYSFFDFDYEERPGTDALRVQYFTSGDSSIEIAGSYTKDWQSSTYAVRYNFNHFNYDFQVLAGQCIDDYVIGTGWEGYIKNIGFKGELSYFTPVTKDDTADNVFTGSMSLDYYFKNGWSLNVGTLYNSNSQTDPISFTLLQNTTTALSPKHLMPNQWSFFAQTSRAFTPALQGSLSAMYANEVDALLLMPQISYSMAQNWDFDTVAQVVYMEQQEEFKNLVNAVFLRLRYSF